MDRIFQVNYWNIMVVIANSGRPKYDDVLAMPGRSIDSSCFMTEKAEGHIVILHHNQQSVTLSVNPRQKVIIIEPWFFTMRSLSSMRDYDRKFLYIRDYYENTG